MFFIQERMQELVDKLQDKVRGYKRQVSAGIWQFIFF